MEKFKLLKDLGGGGFGRTYKVEGLDDVLRRRWGNNVVLKIPHNKGKEKALIEELIKYEILFQNVNPEYIVRYLGFELFEGQYVIAMEFVDGYDLSRLLEQSSKLEIRQVLDLSRQICLGLLEAHRCRVFHRDIKPSNILLDVESNRIKITDFGIARLIHGNEYATTVTGTISYMAPEVIRGDGGFYSDIYSLSVTMYEMLTGELPIKGGSIDEIVKNVQSVNPIPPKMLRPDTPQQLNDLIMKGLEKEVECRYGTVEEILNAIEACGTVDDIRAQIDKAWELFRRGDLVESENLFREVIKKAPSNLDSYLSLAEFYNRCERFPLSLRVLKKAIESSQSSGLLYWNLALVYKQLNKTEEAVKMLKKGIELGLEPKMKSHGQVLLSVWVNTK